MRILTFLIFNLLIFQAILILPDEVRKQFFLQYAKEITLETSTDDYLDAYLDAINYDKAKIEELIHKYNFPESYNFVKETGASVHVKNQENCGCCWAMSATTSLAYRFHKKNISVDLSPQHELSCYLRDCDYGNNVNDPELSLIKNGTITEECLPFTSGDKTIEECPVNNTCKNQSIPYTKYYAKNAYSIGITKNNFYDVTAIIMDQLITKGPVVTSITAYKDLIEFGYDKNCTNKVYNYDGVSENLGGHALSLVGYGLLDGKYYWLIQNSWGDNWCHDGFAKIEFGQVGVGTIGLAEPFIEEEEEFTETINIKYVKQNLDCQLEISAADFNLSNWTNPLNIIFSHENGLHDFNYICGVNKLITEGKEKIYCYYEFLNKIFYKGLYKYKSFQSIGKGNNFTLDKVFEQLNFTYYGYDEIFPLSILIQGKELFNQNYFVSEQGSRITFLFKTESIDKEMTHFIANDKHENPLSNCKKTKSVFIQNNERYIIAYCDIDINELDYFYYYPTQNSSSMLLRRECGYFHYQNIYTYRLDINKYPVFRIKHFIASYNYESTKISALLLADIEGSVSKYAENKNSFYVFVSVERNNKNYTKIMICPTGNPEKIGENYAILCSFEYKTEDKIKSMYLFPLYGILQSDYPFEIIIKDIMKSEDFIPPTPTPTPTPSIGKSLEFSSILILLFTLFL